MMIACPRCGTAFAVEPAHFGRRARTVQCSGCHYRWLHTPEGAFALPEDALPPVADMPPAAESRRAAATSRSPEGWPGPVDDIDSAGLGGNATGTLADSDRSPDEDAAPLHLVPESAAEPSPAETMASADTPAVAAAADSAGPAAVQPTTPSPDPTPALPEPSPLQQPAATATPVAASGRWRVARSALPRRPAAVAGLSAAATIVMLVLLLVLLRAPILAALPQAAGFYGGLGLLPAGAGAGLEIRDVAARRVTDGSAAVLIVSGTVASIAAVPVALPVLRATLYNEVGQAVQAADAAGERPSLAAGETTRFEARIIDPAGAARRIGVTFIPPPDPARP